LDESVEENESEDRKVRKAEDLDDARMAEDLDDARMAADSK